jgi:hypothetical protein
VGHPCESASSLDRKTCTANSGARTRQKDDSSTWFRNQDSSTLDWLRQLQTDLDSMLLSICPKKILGSAHRYDARKSRDHDFRSE